MNHRRRTAIQKKTGRDYNARERQFAIVERGVMKDIENDSDFCSISRRFSDS